MSKTVKKNEVTGLVVSTSPHITKRHHSTRNIMLDVIIALTPAIIAATVFFGHLALLNVVYCVVFCVGFELLYHLIASKKWNKEGLKSSSTGNLSCVVTGIILALNLPTYINIWGLNIISTASGTVWGSPAAIAGTVVFSVDTIIACFFGSLVAIVLAKMLFGGIGRNFANPAAVGRVFLFIAFTFTAVRTAPWWDSALNVTDYAATGATPLGSMFSGAPAKDPTFLQMFLGLQGAAAVGETCVIALILGYIYLCVRKVIDFRLPLMVVASAAIFALLLDGLPAFVAGKGFGTEDMFKNMLMHVLSGGLIFGAVFMATDYSTSPNTFWGSAIFATGIGFFTILIRKYAAAPEGVSFAILIMNMLVPIIDKYIRNKPFGAVNKGRSTVEAKNKSVDTQGEESVSAEGGK